MLQKKLFNKLSQIFVCASLMIFGDFSLAGAPLSKKQLKEKLTDLQYRVTQEDDTEQPFKNDYWDNKKEGIYVDIVSGEPLFSSKDKFVSGTGWPSFTRPLEKSNVHEKKDTKFGMTRIEVRSMKGDSHLGHLFNDGPQPTGLRYCINSASLEFIPKAKLGARGLEKYAKLFLPPKSEISTKQPLETAYFAGGCFWCSEADFEAIKGVKDVVSGYIGGSKEKANYDLVSSGRTAHAEAVRVEYDPSVVSYKELLVAFWYSIDPTVENQQFCDHGPQYRSGIFYRNNSEKSLAAKSLAITKKTLKTKVYTEITKASTFYDAEGYHQDYYKNNPVRYKRYRKGCGRDNRLKKLWGKRD